jgi:hypothetical protein
MIAPNPSAFGKKFVVDKHTVSRSVFAFVLTVNVEQNFDELGGHAVFSVT